MAEQVKNKPGFQLKEDPALSLWDLHRPVRPVGNTPDMKRCVKLPLKALKDFQCPICLGYLNGTVLVMECVHRFCGECIEKCLRIGMKECPSCRIHIPSRRSLRPDVRFDRLVQNMVGHLENSDDEDASEYASRANSQLSSGKRHRSGTHVTNRQRKRRARHETDESNSSSPTDPAPPVCIHNFEPSPLISFLLLRHPQEEMVEPLAREHIVMSGEAPVAVLKKFLSRKLSYAPSSHFQILASVNNSLHVLEDAILLKDVRRSISDTLADSSMVLQYRLIPLKSLACATA